MGWIIAILIAGAAAWYFWPKIKSAVTAAEEDFQDGWGV